MASNTTFKVQAECLTDDSNLTYECGALYIKNDELIVHAGGAFKQLSSAALNNRIVVTQSNFATTIGGVIDSTKDYFIDGIIDLGTTQITVPPTGITITGYSFDLSALTSSEDNYTMFVSESIAIGSGNMLHRDLFCYSRIPDRHRTQGLF